MNDKQIEIVDIGNEIATSRVKDDPLSDIEVLDSTGKVILKGTLEGRIPISFVINGDVYVNTVSFREVNLETKKETSNRLLKYYKSGLTPKQHYCEPVVIL